MGMDIHEICFLLRCHIVRANLVPPLSYRPPEASIVDQGRHEERQRREVADGACTVISSRRGLTFNELPIREKSYYDQAKAEQNKVEISRLRLRLRYFAPEMSRLLQLRLWLVRYFASST